MQRCSVHALVQSTVFFVFRSLGAACVALSLVFLPGVNSSPAFAATLGSGECAQDVIGLTGSVVREGNYCLVALKGPVVSSGTSGSWTVPTDVRAIDYLIVGGGGGGGTYGGGGAGAVYEANSAAVTPGQSISATVGAGGARGTSTAGSTGATSSFNGIDAYGGGGGSSLFDSAGTPGEFDPADIPVTASPNFGGSGGGAIARMKSGSVQRADETTARAETANDVQGITSGAIPDATLPNSGLHRNQGGDSGEVFVFLVSTSSVFKSNLTFLIGGGGGGAGQAGGNLQWASDGTTQGTRFSPGAGGNGKTTTLLSPSSATPLGIGQVSGSDVWFAGGGGGNANFDYNPVWTGGVNGMVYTLGGTAGLGGGGAGTANTGGGGRNANGGSGVILVRYLIPGTEASADSGSSAVARIDGGQIALDVRASEGRGVEGTLVDIAGLGLPPGSTYFLKLYEPETVVAEGSVGGSGNFSQELRLPGGLRTSTYTIELSAVRPGLETLALHRVFEVSADGTFLDVGVNSIGVKPGGVVEQRLAYTGLSSSSLPWWALSAFVMGLALVLYSVRARRIVELAEATAAGSVARTPWEILSTPIRVPGIDYVPGSAPHSGSVSLAEAMNELDLAFSRMIVSSIDSLQTHFSGR